MIKVLSFINRNFWKETEVRYPPPEILYQAIKLKSLDPLIFEKDTPIPSHMLDPSIPDPSIHTLAFRLIQITGLPRLLTQDPTERLFFLYFCEDPKITLKDGKIIRKDSNETDQNLRDQDK